MEVLNLGHVVSVVGFLTNFFHDFALRLRVRVFWLVAQLHLKRVVPGFEFNQLSLNLRILNKIWVRQLSLIGLSGSGEHEHFSMALNFLQHLLFSHILVVLRHFQAVWVNYPFVHLVNLDSVDFIVDVDA